MMLEQHNKPKQTKTSIKPFFKINPTKQTRNVFKKIAKSKGYPLTVNIEVVHTYGLIENRNVLGIEVSIPKSTRKMGKTKQEAKTIQA